MSIHQRRFRFLQALPHFVSFDGEGEGGGEGGSGEGGGGDAGKTYTQEEFDRHMAGMRRKFDTQTEKLRNEQKELAKQLKAAQSQKGLSDEERSALQGRIDQLESEYLTDKEKAERAAAAREEEFTTTVNSLTGERDQFKSLFQREVVNNQIVRAAAENKAFDPSGDQIASILTPLIQFEDILDDDDQPTGNYKAVVNFPDVDTKTKEPITMKYTVAEAVKRMKEMDKHSNLFEDPSRGGVGGSKNGRPAGRPDIAKLAKEDPAEYRRLRRERPDLVYAAVDANRGK